MADIAAAGIDGGAVAREWKKRWRKGFFGGKRQLYKRRVAQILGARSAGG